ncbi:MAG: hypothetical protein K2K91_11425 [Ruminococcus sp.]|nr:hypothetical protein [Ruminococcus sp.]MDE7097725.1 hypothetical protein [Ruminococcus sp.]
MATFYNQATLSYNGNVTGSNITTGQIIEVVSVNKSAVSDTYSNNSDVSYVINIINSGNIDLSGLTVTDNLGKYNIANVGNDLVPLNYVDGTINYYVNNVKQADPTVSATNPLTIEGINVPAKGDATLVYTTKANQFAPLGENEQIENTVTVSGNGILNPVTASATVDYEDGINLAIDKSLAPAVVSENGTLTYTFNIKNFGGTPAEDTDNVVFSDTFNPILNITSVTFNGTPWVLGTDYSYDTDTGTFTSLDGKITVPSATYSQDETTGVWATQPGESTLVITGNITTPATDSTAK